eukprot:CFRG2209T1
MSTPKSTKIPISTSAPRITAATVAGPCANEEDDFETKHVHQVYESIASHFSHTRYKPWPQVEKYLAGLEPGALWADAGCGNGKYLHVRSEDTFSIGSDMSSNLISICSERGLEALVGDVLSLPYRSNSFDNCICIAVIHHMSTPERRMKALQELARIVRPGGTFLVTVWAREQDKFREKVKDSDGDMFVPWKMVTEFQKQGEDKRQNAKAKSIMEGQYQVFQRYYHLYGEGELEELIEGAGGMEIVERGYERDNWWVVVRKL